MRVNKSEVIFILDACWNQFVNGLEQFCGDQAVDMLMCECGYVGEDSGELYDIVAEYEETLFSEGRVAR